MSRSRASIDGGYVRKTISLPLRLCEQIDHHLENTGITISAFLTIAGEDLLKQQAARKKR